MRSSKKFFYYRTRAMWISHKHGQLYHLLKRVDFDVIVDHLALTHIIKNKGEPATTRIKRLLELISSYSFTLYYIKERHGIE